MKYKLISLQNIEYDSDDLLQDLPPYLLPCNKGPYVWDISTGEHDGRLKGMGSEFQWHKPSFIASHLVNGKWIGNLTSGHDRRNGDQSEYFGMLNSHCDENSLKNYHLTHVPVSHEFIFVPKEDMFTYVPNLPSHKITRKTILIFDWETLDESHNFVVFDETFRNNFHKQRQLRSSIKRPTNEYWVSIHFRWGDVATRDPDLPNFRSGLGFSDYCTCIGNIMEITPNAKIFLFAENFPYSESCSFLPSKSIQFFNDSVSWKRDIDIMSQSQLLLGGSSSFFVLGSHLCQNCSVIHSSDKKFVKSEYEDLLPRHLNDIYCGGEVSCYLENINKILI